MSDALSLDSELAAASWLRDPLDAAHQDELVAWHVRFSETANQRQRLSALFEQLHPAERLPIAQVTELRRKIQTVNVWKPNGRSTQTTMLGGMGARAG